MLEDEILLFADADAVLARSGTAEGDGVADDAVFEGEEGGALALLEWNETVEVAVGDVGADDAGESGFFELALRGGDALGELGRGHADVADVHFFFRVGAGFETAVTHGAEVTPAASVPEFVELGAVFRKGVRIGAVAFRALQERPPIFQHGLVRVPHEF